MSYCLAIDIGASSGRHILGWIEDGKMQTEEIYRFQNAPKQVGDTLKWEIERLFEEILSGLKVSVFMPQQSDLFIRQQSSGLNFQPPCPNILLT